MLCSSVFFQWARERFALLLSLGALRSFVCGAHARRAARGLARWRMLRGRAVYRWDRSVGRWALRARAGPVAWVAVFLFGGKEDRGPSRRGRSNDAVLRWERTGVHEASWRSRAIGAAHGPGFGGPGRSVGWPIWGTVDPSIGLRTSRGLFRPGRRWRCSCRGGAFAPNVSTRRPKSVGASGSRRARGAGVSF